MDMLTRLKSYRNGVHGRFFLSVADEIERLQTIVDNRWSKEAPNEIGYWWWWNGDLDAVPVPVNIAWSPTDGGRYFATQGQHGWTRFLWVEEMGGLWIRLLEPPLPESV